ncbi:S-adenosyl-L-methionine-dependent methyltransferase [Cryphonectria parasitica EP155]|uniref:S-adenosyl-L-methionine-dependent methyltransferase n=1 Tax=Cryphonectria parasitica (strain ATCC 38755 / EP155) TaxID=660469 RepID=A0A9P4XTE9_CRYP1|nr:S-adenosyl-L-methionine-dependent methyltransferase [Cryphonectria parasitica EP155]KAF3760649.1 S-adenosyl-L-methionine-dependent methyltransferase [Cryphonectria parasitica EP155]
MAGFAYLQEVFLFLIDPWLFMLESLKHLPPTIFSLLLAGHLTTLLHPSRLQSAWFGRFWASAAPGVRETGEARVIPLLQGRVSAGRVLSPAAAADDDDKDKARASPVSGVVLEVGPGTGMWASVFAHPALRPGITKVYGVEPNTAHHAELQRRAADAGLSGIYEVVPVGIEDLAASGRVQKGSVDCIVSILCLCSIPDPEEHVRQLHGYLKEGGRWFVYEHVRCESERMRESGLAMRVYQAFVNLFWPHLLAGCELCRNTPKTLVEAGSWTTIDLAQPEGEPWYHPLPHILGTLTK